MKKIKQFYCAHCGKLNLVPTAPSAWREQLPEFLRSFTESVTAMATADLITRGMKMGMWTSTPGGAGKLAHMADEHLIKRQGHGWWILTDTGMDMILAAGLSIDRSTVQQLASLEEDPGQASKDFKPTKEDEELLQIVADSPKPISDRVAFQLGRVAGKRWANKWSVGRRMIKVLIANGWLFRPKLEMLQITVATRRYLDGDVLLSELPAMNRAPRVDD